MDEDEGGGFRTFLRNIKDSCKQQEMAIYCDIIERYLAINKSEKIGDNRYKIPVNKGSELSASNFKELSNKKPSWMFEGELVKDKILHALEKISGDSEISIFVDEGELDSFIVSEKAFLEIKEEMAKQIKNMFNKTII